MFDPDPLLEPPLLEPSSVEVGLGMSFVVLTLSVLVAVFVTVAPVLVLVLVSVAPVLVLVPVAGISSCISSSGVSIVPLPFVLVAVLVSVAPVLVPVAVLVPVLYQYHRC